MDNWKPCKLAQTGIPTMSVDEVVLRQTKNTTLYVDNNKQKDYQSGFLYLTNFRLVWVDKTRENPKELRLANISSTSSESTGWFDASYKLIIMTRTGAVLKIKLCDDSSSVFTDWKKQLPLALSRKSWEESERKAREGPKTFSGTSGAQRAAFAGIGGLQFKQKQEEQKGKRLAGSAFQDLDSLMAKAREVVQVAERVAQLSSRENSDDVSAEEQAEFSSLVRSVGIASPVTRDSMGTGGDLFYSELARQLSGFIVKPIDSAGGMLSLMDIYCMYNRARGTELLSPDDLLVACRQLSILKLGMRLRKFPSGVIVVQLDTFSDDAVTEKLKRLLENGKKTYGTGLSAMLLSQEWNVSLLVASEHLKTAELKGALCRDDSASGMRFYANLFL
eukprot:GSMAST32.ASY1.ANO1.2493.1 assembled CDS